MNSGSALREKGRAVCAIFNLEYEALDFREAHKLHDQATFQHLARPRTRSKNLNQNKNKNDQEMYLSDIASESYYSQGRGTRNTGDGGTRDVDSLPAGTARRSSHVFRTSSPAPPTSIPIDDNFDAYTTEVPTEWVVGDRYAEYDRDESVSGYRNYVREMERMLSGQMENTARSQERRNQQYRDQQQEPKAQHPTLRRSSTSISESVRGSPRMARRSLGTTQHAPPSPIPQPSPPLAPPENARQVRGKKGQIELVQQRVLEDSPLRTISLWRERVAQSSAGGSAYGQGDEARSEVDSHVRTHGQAHGHGHRRVLSGSLASDARLKRVVNDHARYVSSVDGSGTRNGSGSVRGTENGGKAGRASYERSEYMVSYQQATKGIPKLLFSPRSEAVLPRETKTPSSPTLSKVYDRAPPSPTLRRHLPRKSQDRSEFMITYPQTPPHTGSQASSGSPKPQGNAVTPRSPGQGSFREGGGSSLRATSTSSVEIILSSCDPSLLHIAPILYDLGIKRVDHLRAIARLSEETRDREVKEQALKRGVTVVEWAIFLDKVQSL